MHKAEETEATQTHL